MVFEYSKSVFQFFMKIFNIFNAYDFNVIHQMREDTDAEVVHILSFKLNYVHGL